MRILSVRLDDSRVARLDNLGQTLGLSQSEVFKAGLALRLQQAPRPAAGAGTMPPCFVRS